MRRPKQSSSRAEEVAVKSGVRTIEGEEGFMRAAFDDFTVVEDEDLIRLSDGAQAMGDDEAGAALHQAGKGELQT